MLGDIRNPKWLYLKAMLLLLVGVLAATMVLLENPNLRTALLLGIAIWGFCRAYYFAFYVIEHYIDPTYKFAGLIAILQYAFSGYRKKNTEKPNHDSQTQIR